MNAPVIVGSRRTVAAIVGRDALAELALDLSAFAQVLASEAPRASAASLQTCIGSVREIVAGMGETLKTVVEAEAAR